MLCHALIFLSLVSLVNQSLTFWPEETPSSGRSRSYGCEGHPVVDSGRDSPPRVNMSHISAVASPSRGFGLGQLHHQAPQGPTPPPARSEVSLFASPTVGFGPSRLLGGSHFSSQEPVSSGTGFLPPASKSRSPRLAVADCLLLTAAPLPASS